MKLLTVNKSSLEINELQKVSRLIPLTPLTQEQENRSITSFSHYSLSSPMFQHLTYQSPGHMLYSKADLTKLPCITHSTTRTPRSTAALSVTASRFAAAKISTGSKLSCQLYNGLSWAINEMLNNVSRYQCSKYPLGRCMLDGNSSFIIVLEAIN